MTSNIITNSASVIELEEKLISLVNIFDKENVQNMDEKLSEEIDCIAKCSLAGSEMGVWGINEKTKKIYFSKTWENFLGYPKEKISTLCLNNFAKTCHPEDREKFEKFLSQVNSKDSKKDKYELFLRVKHNDLGWGSILFRGKVLIRDENDDPKWTFGTYVDLTDFMYSELKKYEFFTMMSSLHHNLPGFVYKIYLSSKNDWSFPYMSNNVFEIFGLTQEDGINNPSAFLNIIHPEDIADVKNSIFYSVENLTSWKKTYRINHPTKGVRWIESHATPQRNEDGSLSAYGYAHDATEIHQARESANFAIKFYENTSDGVLMVDHNKKIVQVNPAISIITGYSDEDLIGQTPGILGSGLHTPEFYKHMSESVDIVGYFQGEVINKRKNGEIYNAILTIELVPDAENSNRKNFIATLTDISELKERQNELIRLENYDYLTNLPNRRFLLEKLENALKDAEVNSTKLAICYIDLDQFKPINDKYGHSFGDRFLCHLADEIVNSVRPEDTVARLGGDEFVVILKGLKDDLELSSLIDSLNAACVKNYNVLAENIKLSASMGVVVYPNVKGNADELIRFADQSMYKAKQQGRKRFVFFDSEKEDASIAHYVKLEQVREALGNNEFTLWYQPKVELSTNNVLGVEALIRWKKPDGKIIPAIDFINIIEGDDLDYQIGIFVIDRALRDQARWHKMGVDISVSVNISPDHLLHPHFEEDLRRSIRKYNSNPKLIIVEILETSRISDFDAVIDRLRSCLKLGVCFSLDDFGTGYSSLGYLRALPTQEVKIDKSFIFSMLKDSQDKMIVQGIIDLSHALGRVVVAEGVETDEHISELKKMGADLIQGYGVSKPLPEENLLAWIKIWES